MAAPFPAMRVDHVSIAVRAMGPTLARWQRLFPVRLRRAPRPGYDGEFRWTDFFLGDRKLELIESARPGSFVERFLAAYGQRWHHLSLDLEEGALELVETTRVAGGFHHLTIDVDPLGAFLDRLEAEGIRPARGAGNALVELDGATLLLREGARPT